MSRNDKSKSRNKTVKSKKNKTVKKSRNWKNIGPTKNKESRKRMKNKYGSRCFIEPKTLKYPICNRRTGEVECMGLNNAQYYLHFHVNKPDNKYKKMMKKVKTLKKKYC